MILKSVVLFVMLAAGCVCARGQEAATGPVVTKSGCCGPVTEAGWQLLHVLDGMDVEHRWLADRYVHWESGRPRGAILTDGKPHTHCSAFTAAVGERLGIYMLRPPEHSQLFLATAQGQWFTTDKAAQKGWVRVMSAQEAQARANRGELVVLDWQSPDPKKHGHIAVVRPAVKSDDALERDGPETMQAGQTNFADGNAVRSFKSHPGAWPNEVLIFAHATKMSAAEKHVAFEEDKTPGEEALEPLP